MEWPDPPEAERVVDIARSLVAVDSSNPPGDTRAVVDVLAEWLEDAGIRTDRIARGETKPNICATVHGTSDATLLYNGHLDTVPYDKSAWQYDPLGERDGERLYGRGTADMKGAVAAMVGAAIAWEEAAVAPPVDLRFGFVSDEETGGSAGVDALLDDGFCQAAGCVIGENTCLGDRHSVTVADKGAIWLTLTATGTSAHGSRPMLGTNAIDRLYRAIDAIRELLADISYSDQAALDRIHEESVAFYADALGQSAAEQLFEQPTLNLGTFAGGESINAVPGHAEAELDIRLPGGVQATGLYDQIDALVEMREGVDIADVSCSTGTYVDVDDPIVTAVVETATAKTETTLYRRSATGGGDAKTLRNAGVPTVEFAFGPDQGHAVDEYTTVEALDTNAAVYTRLPTVFADHATLEPET
jgi:succinyl-diaminopimelate desuccinylase